MSLVKKAGIVFLSFLLFVSLSVFGMAFAMNRTILNPEFAIAQIDRLDVPALAGELLREQVPLEEVPGEMGFIVEAVEDTIADLEPWMKQQTNTVIYAGYDYLLGESESLNIVIDMSPVKDSLRESVWQALLVSPPPEVAGLPPAELERLFNEFYEEFSEQIPATVEINESTIAAMSPETMDALEQARQYVGYLQLAYRISIGVMIAVIVGLVFLHRRVRGATRSIGIPCLTCGISAFVWAMVAKYFATSMIGGVEIPTQLQAWLPQFINDLFAPLKMYGIGLMVAGIALLIVSVVYKRHEPSS